MADSNRSDGRRDHGDGGDIVNESALRRREEEVADNAKDVGVGNVRAVGSVGDDDHDNHNHNHNHNDHDNDSDATSTGTERRKDSERRAVDEKDRMHYVTVLLFANARDLADGTGSVRVPLSNALQDAEQKGMAGVFSVRDVVESLCRIHPALKDSFEDFAIALNEAIVSMDDQVRPNDTLAVLPPVSGG